MAARISGTSPIAGSRAIGRWGWERAQRFEDARHVLLQVPALGHEERKHGDGERALGPRARRSPARAWAPCARGRRSRSDTPAGSRARARGSPRRAATIRDRAPRGRRGRGRAFSACRWSRTRPRRARSRRTTSTTFSSHLHHGDHHELRDALERVHHERLAAAIPARDEDLALVVRVDEAHEVAQHDAVLVAQAGARDEDRGEPRIAEVDREPRRDQRRFARARA